MARSTRSQRAPGARDCEGRRRVGVWLPDECLDWLDETARQDRSTRSDLLEGLVLLAMDGELEAAWAKIRRLEEEARCRSGSSM